MRTRRLATMVMAVATTLVTAMTAAGCSTTVESGGDDGRSADAPAGPGDGPLAPDAGLDGGPTTLTPGTSTINLTVAGRARTAILYVPATATATSQLVIALHGNGDTAANFLASSGIKALADADGTVVLVPQGVRRDVFVTLVNQTVPGIDWDGYNSTAQGNIDIPLLDQLRTQLVLTHQVDAHHVFVFGYSQGGYLAFAYGMLAGGSLSCSAVLAAASGFGGGANDPLITAAPRKLAVVLQVGTNDSAYGPAQTTAATLQQAGFPTQLHAIAGAGHVPIPGSVAVPWSYCRGQAL